MDRRLVQRAKAAATTATQQASRAGDDHSANEAEPRWWQVSMGEPRWWLTRAPAVLAVAGLVATVTFGGDGGARPDALEPAASDEACPVSDAPTVMGESGLTRHDMTDWWLMEHGTVELPGVEANAEDLISYYYGQGEVTGVRGDIAFAQAMFQTGRFASPEAQEGANNYGALVDHTAAPDDDADEAQDQAFQTFDTPQDGVQAHLDHLVGYAEQHSRGNDENEGNDGNGENDDTPELDLSGYTWDMVGDDYVTDPTGVEYWEDMVGALYQEMVDHATELAEAREAGEGDADDSDTPEADGSEGNGSEGNGAEGNDSAGDDDPEADPEGDRPEGADPQGSGTEGEREVDECVIDPCIGSAAETLGYSEPSFADDFDEFDTDRWELVAAPAQTASDPDGNPGDDDQGSADPDDGSDEVDGNGDDGLVQLEDGNLSLIQRHGAEDNEEVFLWARQAQRYGLWEVQSRLPADALGYEVSLELWVSADGPPGGPSQVVAFTHNDASDAQGRTITADYSFDLGSEPGGEGDNQPDADDGEADDGDADDDGGNEGGGNDDDGDADGDTDDAGNGNGDGADRDSDGRSDTERAEISLNDNGWHNWAIEWTPDQVALYLDGEVWHQTPDGADIPDGIGHLLVRVNADHELDDEEEAADEYRFDLAQVRTFGLQDEDNPDCDPPESDDAGEGDESDDPDEVEQSTSTTSTTAPVTSTTAPVEQVATQPRNRDAPPRSEATQARHEPPQVAPRDGASEQTPSADPVTRSSADMNLTG